MPVRWAHAIAFASTATLAPVPAFAQSATALDRFEPAPAGDGSFAVPRASVLGHLRPSVALTFSYAHNPLKLYRYGADPGQTISSGAIVSHQLIAHVLASFEIAQRVKLDLNVPFTVNQGGDSPEVDPQLTAVPQGNSQPFRSPNGTSMNDVRLGARIALVRQRGWVPAASLTYSIWFPSGNSDAYTSTGHVRHAPAIVIGAEHTRLSWSVMAGRRVQDNNQGRGLAGSEIIGGASVGIRFDKLTIHGEVFGSAGTADRTTLISAQPSLELLVGARYAFGPLMGGLGAGPGLSNGIGTPTFRVLATIGTDFDAFTKKTSGGEGVILANGTRTSTLSPANRVDVASNPTRISDRDADGVADAEDVCPDVIGDARATAIKRGCPPDRDGDSIVDGEDRCPDEKGVQTPDPARYGCPLDSDADGIADATDACPQEKGEVHEDAKKNGCPHSVRVEGTQIVILQEVNFATGSDVIQPDSFALLEQVAAVMIQHPEIARVAVDGHTDNAGIEKANIILSQKRAVAVVVWLVDHGIDTRRLEARGFGPRRPVASNDTPAGKAKNRRVEFQILRRSADGSSDWRAGSVP